MTFVALSPKLVGQSKLYRAVDRHMLWNGFSSLNGALDDSVRGNPTLSLSFHTLIYFIDLIQCFNTSYIG
jgi:hypothetical protein